jgi:uncharacterized protein (TIGR03437 family)
MKLFLRLIPLALVTANLFGQAAIDSGGIVNAASFAIQALPNAGIARGSIFTIFGRNLGPAQIAFQPAYPLQRTLQGVSLRVAVGGQTVDAIPVYVLANQVAAILPSNTPLGNATLTLTYNGSSTTGTFRVADRSFGAFSANQQGRGPAVVFNFVGASSAPQFNQPNQSARPGQVLTLWGTGLGPLASGDDTQAPAPTNQSGVTVEVGGRTARVEYAGRGGASAGAGIDQINFVVPDGVSGCSVPITVTVGGVTSNTTTLAVAAAGGACSDPNGLPTSVINNVGTGPVRLGVISLNRSSFTIPLPVPVPGFDPNNTTDGAFATFSRYPDLQTYAATGQEANTVSIGACTVFTYRSTGTTTEVPRVVPPVALPAGTLTLTGPGISRPLRYDEPSKSYSLLGSSSAAGVPDILPLFLNAGEYTISGSGGSGTGAVGPFSVRLTIGAPINWTNRDSTTVVNRSRGQEITWTGGLGSDQIFITGGTFQTSGTTGIVSSFSCLVPNNGRFTIPASVLSNILPSVSTSGIDTGNLSVGSYSNGTQFNASGLDHGVALYSSFSGKSLRYE